MHRKAEFTSNHLYPTSDGKPMAETDRHRQIMVDLIEILQAFYVQQPKTYVTGNLLLFYEKGNKRKHLSPDCFVVFGVPNHERLNYLTWEEGRCPDVVFEITSSSTRHKDVTRKFEKYRDVLKVKEYFLFDPYEDYLFPSMQGFRLRAGEYVSISPKAGRIPSAQLGLHLERHGNELRLWNPATGQWLDTAKEQVALKDELLATKEKQLVLKDEQLDSTKQELAEALKRAQEAEAALARLQPRK